MKKKFLAVALTASMVLGSVASAFAADEAKNPLLDGLTGFYTFDDTLKNEVGAGEARLHGGAGDTWNTPATGTATYAEGKDGKGYSFSGDTKDGETLVRGEGLELDAKVSGTEFTIAGWIKAENFGVPTSSMMFAVNTVKAENDAIFSLNTLNGYNGSVLLGKIWDWDHRGDTFVCLDGDGTAFGLNEWIYVTVTGKSGEQKLYFNGELKNSANSENDLVVKNLTGATIFLGINWWDDSFKGVMDNVVVYDRALSADEVTALFNKDGNPKAAIDSPSGNNPEQGDSPSGNNPEQGTTPDPNPTPNTPVTPNTPATPSTGDLEAGEVSADDVAAVEKAAAVEGAEEGVNLDVNAVDAESDDYKAASKYVEETIKAKAWAVLDLKLMKGDEKVQPNGKIKVTLPLFENIKDAKYVAVYRLDNDKFTHLGTVEVKDSKFTFETDHFSTYLFAAADKPAENETVDGTEKPTGDSAPIAPIAGVMAAAILAVGTAVVTSKKKNA